MKTKSLFQIYKAGDVEENINSIANFILSRHEQEIKGHNFALIGIQTRGVTIAKRLQNALEKKTGVEMIFGSVGITLYRDDISHQSSPQIIKPTEISDSIDDKILYLIDDVLFTGRTIRAALNEITDIGRPRIIGLAVLVDRKGRQLPIQADFAARKIDADYHERIEVKLKETDPDIDEGIYILKKES